MITYKIDCEDTTFFYHFTIIRIFFHHSTYIFQFWNDFCVYSDMKFKGIISVILLFIYSVATLVGVGVIRCGCTNSQQLVVLSFHPSCLCSDADDHCCPHNDRHHDEDEETVCQDKDCCSFVYKYVNVDHLNVKQSNDYIAKALTLLFVPCVVFNGLTDSIYGYPVDVKNNSPPFCLLKIPLIYMHGQLRL